MSLAHTVIALPVNGPMNTLTRAELAALLDTRNKGLHELFRRCVLAVLNTGSDIDNVNEILALHHAFKVDLVQRGGTVELLLENAPEDAFVDGQIIAGIQEHVHAVLWDILYVHNELASPGRFDLGRSADITDAVFHILRNAGVLQPSADSRLVVCWGGHAIGREEYEYTKQVGYELGLRGFDICTGCGPGAMKGPMKGAAVGHGKQRSAPGRYVGITEPGIIAAEAPNPIVNELVITPDIEKRLEAFVRIGHGFVVFPGGVGTLEELFYILGVLLHPANRGEVFPLVLSGPASAENYFTAIDDFVGTVLGSATQARYQIVLDDAKGTAAAVQAGIARALNYRAANNDARYFHWRLHVEDAFQKPFEPTHQTMTALNLSRANPPDQLAADIRRTFSGIVAANIKAAGQVATADKPFVIHGEKDITQPFERLLRRFEEQGRMTLQPATYSAAYRFETIA